MKTLRAMSLSILMVLFITVGVTYAQSTAEESYYKGVEYGAQGEFQKAQEEFENVPKVDPFYQPAKGSLKVIKDFNEQKIKRLTVIYLFKGTSYANKGQYDKAISDYTNAVHIIPRYANAYLNRGIAYFRKGQYDQAISDFTKTIELNPKDADAYYNRGVAYFRKGQYDQAISDYTKTLELNPQYADAYYSRGLIYTNKGQYDQAINSYTKALEINPKYVKAYNNRGFVYTVKLGNKIKGCADWKKACELGNCKNYNLAKQEGYCQ